MAHEDIFFTKVPKQNSSAGTSLDFEPKLEYVFVEKLQDRYKCASCCLVLHNPHQTGCGHRFCEKCVMSLSERHETSICPIDKETINPQEIFKDNCCKREVLNLQVYCKNTPDCDAKSTLGRFQDHLDQCLYQPIQCSNKGCHDQIPRKHLKTHLETQCKLRKELCGYCKQSTAVVNLPIHVKQFCPLYPVPCPNNCSQTSPREELDGHLSVCPEVELECPFANYGCNAKVKRGEMKSHEDAFLHQHVLCVLNRNTQLEKQVLDLKHNLELKENKIQKLSETIKWCEMECKQFAQLNGVNGSHLSSTQTVAGYIEKAAWMENQVLRLVELVSQEQGWLDLRPLMEKIDCANQKIVTIERYKDRLEHLENQSSKHDLQINIQKSQLSSNEDRFQLLEGTCYNGKLIWKITDYKRKKREASEGRVVSIHSQHFYTSRCGYRLCARAYLNGDGSGKGGYLSLYFVVMKGEFDSLLPWPFKQKVTLMLLDQSGKRNHIIDVFKADPNSSSFKRPEGDMNIASGCPRFVPHIQLENPKNACYIKEDTIFIKVSVDLTDLEEL
ncbi:TNF receptor-associated factor 5 [Spea bombifrons]|uniref:TNF receptor-associated factor 5 n=1 Tax=Spea bombifrons TaxID=233779 RepID=UPI00234B6CF0|nr:TNF receptor-associated factor 5 [Spea bombifrons]